MPSGLLGFCLLQTYVKLVSSLGWMQRPLSAQENTVLQTCGVAGAALSQFIQVFLSEFPSSCCGCSNMHAPDFEPLLMTILHGS